MAGRLVMGTLATTMAKVPLVMPAAPAPARERPMMSIVDELALPHKREPISNRRMDARKTG